MFQHSLVPAFNSIFVCVPLYSLVSAILLSTYRRFRQPPPAKLTYSWIRTCGWLLELIPRQALTLGLWMQWPAGPVDLKTYWPPKKLTAPPQITGPFPKTKLTIILIPGAINNIFHNKYILTVLIQMTLYVVSFTTYINSLNIISHQHIYLGDASPENIVSSCFLSTGANRRRSVDHFGTFFSTFPSHSAQLSSMMEPLWCVAARWTGTNASSVAIPRPT